MSVDGYQADRSVVAGAVQVVGQQLVHRAPLHLPLQRLLPRELERVQTHLHEAELEVRQPPHPRGADVLQLRRARAVTARALLLRLSPDRRARPDVWIPTPILVHTHEDDGCSLAPKPPSPLLLNLLLLRQTCGYFLGLQVSLHFLGFYMNVNR